MITLEEAKAQLRVDEHWDGDDALIRGYIASATAIVKEYTGIRSVAELSDDELEIAKQACRLIVDQYYNQPKDREPEMPFGAIALCRQLRRYNR